MPCGAARFWRRKQKRQAHNFWFASAQKKGFLMRKPKRQTHNSSRKSGIEYFGIELHSMIKKEKSRLWIVKKPYIQMTIMIL